MLQDMEEISISIGTKQNWRGPYRAALAEANPALVRRKIDLACTAILQRIDELAGACDASAIEEQLEIVESLRQLRTIQRREFQSSVDASQPTTAAAQEGAI